MLEAIKNLFLSVMFVFNSFFSNVTHLFSHKNDDVKNEQVARSVDVYKNKQLPLREFNFKSDEKEFEKNDGLSSESKIKEKDKKQEPVIQESQEKKLETVLKGKGDITYNCITRLLSLVEFPELYYENVIDLFSSKFYSGEYFDRLREIICEKNMRFVNEVGDENVKELIKNNTLGLFIQNGRFDGLKFFNHDDIVDVYDYLPNEKLNKEKLIGLSLLHQTSPSIEMISSIYKDITLDEIIENKVSGIVDKQKIFYEIDKKTFLGLYKRGIKLEEPETSSRILRKLKKTNDLLSHLDVKMKKEKVLNKYFLSQLLRDAKSIEYKLAEELEKDGKIQEAIWAYQRSGTDESYQKANDLIQILNELFEKGEIIETNDKVFGGRSAKKVQMRHTINGKEYSAFGIKKPFGLYANPQYEKFASFLNDYLKIHLVPKTVVRNVQNQEYSVQYFLKDSITYVRASGDKKSNREIYLNDLKTFDYLTLNADRHSGNYLIGTDQRAKILGRCVPTYAIDNGSLFGFGENLALIESNVHRLTPSLRFFIALQQMEPHLEEFKKEAAPMIGEFGLDVFLKRRKNIIDVIQKRLETETINEIWPTVNSRMNGTLPRL